MAAILHLNLTWEHTLAEILNHDPKSQMGIIMRAWVKDNDMETSTQCWPTPLISSLHLVLFCHYKEKADLEKLIMTPTTPLQELYNLGGTLHML